MRFSDVVLAPSFFENPSFYRPAPDSDGKYHVQYSDCFFVPSRFSEVDSYVSSLSESES